MVQYSRLLKNLGKPYMHGEDIREVQRALIAAGHLQKGEDDGCYGPVTKIAVIAYQEAKKLKPDGIVGIITWGSLFPIHTMPTIDTIQAKLCAHVAASEERGDIYVLGSQGQHGTAINEPWIRMREHGNIINIRRDIKLWNARKAAGLDVWAFDCSGLIMYLLIKEGYTDSDTNANGIYLHHCHAIDRTELRAGDLVFKYSALERKIVHVGVYMGDGTVIHSKGRDDGVVREPINSTGWNRYGRLK